MNKLNIQFGAAAAATRSKTPRASSCRQPLRHSDAETQRARWNRSRLGSSERHRRSVAPNRLAASRLFGRLLLASLLIQATHFGPTSAKSISIAPVNLASSDKSPPASGLGIKHDSSPLEFVPPSSANSTSAERIPLTSKVTETSSPAKTTSSSNSSSSSPETWTTSSQGADNDSAGAGDADYDAASGESVSSGEPAARAHLSDLARLVEVQEEFQAKVREQLAGATRNSMEMFEKLSLSGGCTSSLMNLMMGLSGIKSYALKFIDASAKIPSGMMYGLLSDFGDFDQCLSIRSEPGVEPCREVEEGAYSGKYCLLSVRLKYHIAPGPNGSAPEGIIPDGVFWDELVRNYWTSNATKGFQVGVCVPSRCSQDDLEQIYALLARTNNFEGGLSNCQDGNDLRRQHTPDLLQLIILDVFLSLLALSIIATFLERHRHLLPQSQRDALTVQLVVCFSIRRNWRLFLQQDEPAHCADKCRLLPDQHELAETSNVERQLPGGQQSFLSDATASTKVELAPETSLSRSNSSESEPHTDVSSGGSQSSRSNTLEADRATMDIRRIAADCYQRLSVKVSDSEAEHDAPMLKPAVQLEGLLGHLSGLKLLVIVWITVGHSFLYPSANNYQYYRSIISMNITRDSVWFAATNFTLGIDTLLYLVGLSFVCKLADSARTLDASRSTPDSARGKPRAERVALDILRLLVRKILRFWPTYVAVIALAIVIPLISDGPMWPEMVERRLGAACRRNWWANLLMVNNFTGADSICIPSSWFVSVMMQCLLLGSLVVFVERKCSQRLALALVGALIAGSSLVSFAVAYRLGVRAPAIRMDESFVLEIDDAIYRLYTSTFSNLAPFLAGMLGGFALVRWSQRRSARSPSPRANRSQMSRTTLETAANWLCELNLALAVCLVAVLVLSSVFHQHYTRFWAAVYWSCHRLGWALVSGYLVHQCAIGRWRLLSDLLSLNSFRPLSKLLFIAYLLFPIFIHLHSGLVRDGLHISIYNMLNIYTTRLAMCFSTALALHLLVELPLRSVEEIFLASWPLADLQGRLLTEPRTSRKPFKGEARAAANRLPLLAVAQPADCCRGEHKTREAATNGPDEKEAGNGS